MTIQQIMADPAAAFKGFNAAQSKQFLSIIDHIIMLAEENGVDVYGWDILSIFAGDKPGSITPHYGIATRLFFAEAERLAKLAPPEPVVEIGEVIQKELKKYKDQTLERRRQDLKRAVQAAFETADLHKRSYTSELNKAANAEEALKALTTATEESTVFDQVKKIQDGTYWRFLDFKDNHLVRFVTQRDVILRTKNPAAGIDISVNMGKYRGVFDIHGPSFFMEEHENNLVVAGQIHVWGGRPRAQGYGFCWGDAERRKITAARAYDLVTCYDILAGLLSQGTEGSIHVSIEAFYEERKRLEDEKNKEWKILAKPEVALNLAPGWLAGALKAEEDALRANPVGRYFIPRQQVDENRVVFTQYDGQPGGILQYNVDETQF